MRFLILSDLHANWQALQAVLEHAEGAYDQIVCCGDLVGYNPAPERVLEWTRGNCAAVIRGNHDKVVAGVESLDWFNEVAQIAARWTIERLNQDQLQYLGSLPKGPITPGRFHIWHGSPRDEDEYVTGPREAEPQFQYFEQPVAFFGHTHLQGLIFSKHRRLGTGGAVPKKESEVVIELDGDVLYLINPGSVGQPRDGDPRAAYAIFDEDESLVLLRRVEYDLRGTAEDILRAGLPPVLAERLFLGF